MKKFVVLLLFFSISAQADVISKMFSEKGEKIDYKSEQLLYQIAEAKDTKINSTIGVPRNNDSSLIIIKSIADLVSLPPEDVFPYVSVYGKPELRSLWLKEIKRKNPSLVADISLPVVSASMTNGLSIVATLFVNPGDEIIIHDIYWDPYKLIFEKFCGGKLTTYNTFKNGRFDLDSFKQKLLSVKPGKKIILILNFPNNPSGYTLLPEEAAFIATWIKNAAYNHDIVVICDDAYFGLVYEDGLFTESLFTKLANLHERVLAIKIDGVSKEEYSCGLRIGFITYGIRGATEETYKGLEDKSAAIIAAMEYNPANVSQSLIIKSHKSPTFEQEKRDNLKLLKAKYLKLKEVLSKNKQKYEEFFTALPCNGGYTVCLKLKEGLDGDDIRKKLIEKYSTGILSINNMLRVAFVSLPENDIPKLFDNIYADLRAFTRE